MSDRTLIVNADDFGRSPGVNEGIVRAHEDGIVTSATLMVRWPAAEQAAAYARGREALSVGLHLDLGEWAYRNGEWQTLYRVLEDEGREAVTAEVAEQLARFERLLGRPPTHLDSHQHVHREDPARAALLEAGRRLRIPVRGMTKGIEYSGVFYGQGGRGESAPERVGVEALVTAIESLRDGVTELGCHPTLADDHDTMYRRERMREVETLCDPKVRLAVERCDVSLASFAELPLACGALEGIAQAAERPALNAKRH